MKKPDLKAKTAYLGWNTREPPRLLQEIVTGDDGVLYVRYTSYPRGLSGEVVIPYDEFARWVREVLWHDPHMGFEGHCDCSVRGSGVTMDELLGSSVDSN